ncbi:MAG: TldD/PmbA family protein [Candidatus Aegiribacteria sp.]|nr:TldD/PmbA family protein [Candidatus Aegiribacteria sp.]
MKKLLDMAAEKSDQAEVFFIRNDFSSLEMRNEKTSDMSATIQSGYALRILKDGRIGTAYTKNLLDRKELVSNALNSLKGNVKAGFSFPGPSEIPAAWVPDGSVSRMGYHDLHSRSEKVLDYLRGEVKGQIDVNSGRGVMDVAVMNTGGLDFSRKCSSMYIIASLLFPNTETAVREMYQSREIGNFPDSDLEKLVKLYNSGLPEVDIPTGKMKVVFTPNTMYTLLWRISKATSGGAFYNKVSPLQDRLGEKVLSEKFTLYGDPTDPEEIDQHFFDDEGVPTKKHTVFEKGVFQNLILNLDYADKLNKSPVGTGYRSSMWGGETIALSPSPSLECSRIATGDVSFEDMISNIDRGVIVLGILGAHSGNILNGDFSVGLNPGYYVENGKIKGRVRDGMVAGNVYDVLQNIESVENRLHDSFSGGKYPSILLNDVSVAAK